MRDYVKISTTFDTLDAACKAAGIDTSLAVIVAFALPVVGFLLKAGIAKWAYNKVAQFYGLREVSYPVAICVLYLASALF